MLASPMSEQNISTHLKLMVQWMVGWRTKNLKEQDSKKSHIRWLDLRPNRWRTTRRIRKKTKNQEHTEILVISTVISLNYGGWLRKRRQIYNYTQRVKQTQTYCSLQLSLECTEPRTSWNLVIFQTELNYPSWIKQVIHNSDRFLWSVELTACADWPGYWTLPLPNGWWSSLPGSGSPGGPILQKLSPPA